jgi:hypothetical protein
MSRIRDAIRLTVFWVRKVRCNKWIWQQTDCPSLTWSDEQMTALINQTESQLQALLLQAGALADE